MLNEHFFQENFKRFCEDFQKDYGNWTLGLMYKKLGYLKPNELVTTLEACLLERDKNFLPVPLEVLRTAEKLFPYTDSDYFKEKRQMAIKKEKNNSKKDCNYCENKGIITATKRIDSKEYAFKCFCEWGKEVTHDADEWRGRYLKDYIPKYEALRRMPHVNSLGEIFFNEPKKPNSVKAKLLTEQIFQQIVN